MLPGFSLSGFPASKRENSCNWLLVTGHLFFFGPRLPREMQLRCPRLTGISRGKSVANIVSSASRKKKAKLLE
jgi:hypothetical protein